MHVFVCVHHRTSKGAESFLEGLEDNIAKEGLACSESVQCSEFSTNKVRTWDTRGLADPHPEGEGPFKHECLNLDSQFQTKDPRELSRLL